jgi:hypothetical protein
MINRKTNHEFHAELDKCRVVLRTVDLPVLVKSCIMLLNKMKYKSDIYDILMSKSCTKY